VVIRIASYADLAEVLVLLRHLSPNDLPPDPATAEAAWVALLGSKLTTVFVADGENGLASTCMLAIIPNLTRGAKSFGVIENVVTHPGQRRTGLARAILAAALEAAWKAGCYKVMLASGRDEDTLRFYERCGFKRGSKTHFEARRL
jgi:GNAT superfamily N-acetyltransferase